MEWRIGKLGIPCYRTIVLILGLGLRVHIISRFVLNNV